MKVVLTGIVAVALFVGLATLPSLAQGTNGAPPKAAAAGEAPAKETGAVTGKVIDSNNNPVKAQRRPRYSDGPGSKDQ